MAQLQDARLPLPACAAGRASHSASISLLSFNGLGTASSTGREEPPELLGLSAGPPPVSMGSETLPRTLSRSHPSTQQLYPSHFPSDYDCPPDLDLTDQPGSQQDWGSYQVTDNNNNNNNDEVDLSLQSHATAEPPWNPIHINGAPPSQFQCEQMERSSSISRVGRVGQQRSIAGSHAHRTDSGYYTHSQVDARSLCSGDSIHMYQVRLGQSSIPRTIPSTQGQAALSLHSDTPSYRTVNHQVQEAMEPPKSSPDQPEPFHCAEPNCDFTSKTNSDLKKHTARHKREHVCTESGCRREGEGFATINDLARHQKAVHKMKPSHGQSRTYKCFGANCKEQEHEKEWPRLDNFKQHLIRMHKAESTDELIRRSDAWYDDEKKPLQSASVSAPESQSSESHLPLLNTNQWHETSSPQQQSPNHLSPGWKPTANLVRRQQMKTPNRPRSTSTSTQPDPSSRAFSFDLPASRQSQTLGTSSEVAYSRGHVLGDTSSRQFSSDSVDGYANQLSHGRFVTAFTLPNPDTSALSDLLDLGSPSYPSNSASAPVDLAQIASNFPSEQQQSLPSTDPNAIFPSTSTTRAQTSSSSSPISWEALRAFIECNASGHQRDAVIERIMQTCIEVRSGSHYRLPTATTTSPAPSSVRSTNLTSNPEVTDSHLPYRCTEPDCTKRYPRKCDLKKHLIRHRRPFGCTFSKCTVKFGSKHDWKRHESSQHFQQECWKCISCTNNNPKIFYKQSLYEKHLQDVHSASPHVIADHVVNQRIGRGCKSRFWCGFCHAIMVLQKKGVEGVDERFNHIANHFNDGLKIEEWVDVDASGARGRLASETEEDDVDGQDVLGSDGIDGGDAGAGDDHDEPMDEPESYTFRAAQPTMGQKRPGPAELDVSVSSSSKIPSSKRPRNELGPGRGPKHPVASVFCHLCGNGPWLLKQYVTCVVCDHKFCHLCTDDHGERVGNSG